MSEWKKVKLGEVCEISAGGDRPQIFSNHRTDKCRIPIYSNGIDNEGLYGFTDTPKNNGNAITITGRGANAGTVFYRKDPFLSIIRLLTLTPNSEIINAKYLFYLLKNKTFLSTGSAQPQITVPNISQFEIEFNPDIETQHRVATILSRYDSLIENYQKQIKLLEEAAQRLYKEWFVDLRFPGHENTNIIDGVPEGWEKKKVKEVCDTTSGGTPSRSKTEFYTGDILWVKTKELNDDFIFDTEEKITEDAIRNSSAKMVPSGSILMAMYGATIGKLGIATKELSCNQACCVFLLPEDSTLRLYLYNWLLNSRTLLISMGKGAAQPNLSQDMIKNLEVVVPSSCLLAKFDSKVKPLYRIMSYHSFQLRLLTEARDRLLPKLMSGEIEI